MGKLKVLVKKGFYNLQEFGFKDTFRKAMLVASGKVKSILHFSRYSKKPKSFVLDRERYRVEYQEFIDSSKGKRALVLLHLFYMDGWVEIKDYLKNLECYEYDLVITYIEKFKKPKVVADILSFKPDAKLIVVENKGYDLGPFIYALRDIDLSQYDVVFKMHGKGIKRPFIFIYDQIFKGKDWFLQLWDGVLGPKTVHETMKKLLTSDSIGLVAADNLIVKDPLHKQSFTIDMAKSYGIDVPKDYEYVAGTCFAVKAQALECIKALDIPQDAFKKAEAGKFSYAHMLERLVCVLIDKDYDFSGNEIIRKTYDKELAKYRKNSAMRLLNDDRFLIDYEFFYKVLETRPVYDYEVVNVKIADIRRAWNGKKLPITECHAYKYLMGDTEQYLEYCKENKVMHSFDMKVERFDELISSVAKDGFKDTHIIVVDEDNMLKDGQHRLAILCKEHGMDYEVKVLRVYCKGPKK